MACTALPHALYLAERHLVRVGELLANQLRTAPTPHCVALSGPVGAGKSVLARSFVRRFLRDPEATVPSPTFALLHSYAHGHHAVHHADLYRLGDSVVALRRLELPSLMQPGHVLLVEWPELLLLEFPEWPVTHVTFAVEPDGLRRVNVTSTVASVVLHLESALSSCDFD